MADKKAHVSRNTGNNEWYTPEHYIAAARLVMGDIDLDPASCALANKTVKAKKYYGKDEDGLVKPWHGNVWLNPPYAQPLINKFADKVCQREFDQAIVLVNNATETKWFQALASQADAMCFPSTRIKFVGPEGAVGQPLQGQAFLYYSADVSKYKYQFDLFKYVFGTIGLVMIPVYQKAAL